MIELGEHPQNFLRSSLFVGEKSGVKVQTFGSNFRLSQAMNISDSRTSPYSRPLSHKNGQGAVRKVANLPRAVTVIEVLFAMVVMLVGLVGMVALLPMAGRQASDSYSLTHGSAALQNVREVSMALDLAKPSASRPWWYPNDASVSTTTVKFASVDASVDYVSFQTKTDLLNHLMQRRWDESAAVPNRDEFARREGLAQGLCIDPLYCADQFREGWRYAQTYEHDRGATNQGVFRRSRMPFLDERTGLTSSGTGYAFRQNVLGNQYELPKLIRLSFVGRTNGTLPINLQNAMADSFVRLGAGGGDLSQAVATEDNSFGPLRNFSASGNGMVSSSESSRISWLATLTPNEITGAGLIPQYYDLSLVVFSNRDRNFDAAPLAVTGSDQFALGEKICFATAPDTTSPFVTNCGQLPYSQSGGSFEIRLWSDQNTDPKIKVDDWVMLSRRIVLGNFNVPIESLKIIHRHRWYRITNTESLDTWDNGIKVRVAGDPWDYPDIYYKALNVPINANSTAPVYSRDLETSVSDLDYVITTATVFPGVVSVFKNTIELQ
jgi:Tfp pilus assembly protein PilV